jgi:hypothetical protein
VMSKVQLVDIATRLLEESQPGALLSAAQEYSQLCIDIAGEPDATATQLDVGVAISPVDAGRCVLDVARTAAFLRGTRAALEELRRRRSGQPIYVLYAGCGPFAPLALPLLALADHDDVKWVLLDIHRPSLAHVQCLTEHWDMRESIAGLLECDATRPPFGKWSADLVIAEVMQRALSKEPQVAVTAALSNHVKEDGFFLPKTVELRLCLADLSQEFTTMESESTVLRPRVRVSVGSVLKLDLEGASGIFERAARAGGVSVCDLEVPEFEHPKELHLIVQTAVEVFGNERLGDYDSGLTVPLVLHDVGMVKPGDRLRCVYEVGLQPELRVLRQNE